VAIDLAAGPRARRRNAGLIGVGFIVVSSACFGSGGTAAKSMLAAGLSPLQVVQARVTITAVVLLTVLVVARPGALRVRRDEWPLLIGYGLLGFFTVQSFYVLALTRLPVGLALLIQYSAPVLVALWVRLVRRSVLPRTVWLGAGLAVCGLAMVAQVWHGFRLDGLGVGAALCAAVGLAAYFLLSERGLTADRDPLGLVTWGAMVCMLPLVLLAPPLRFPFAALAVHVPVGPWSLPAWLPMLWLSLVSTVAAYLTGVAALRYLPAQVVSVLCTIEVLMAAAIAWVLLGEELMLAQLTGGAVLLAGVVVVQLKRAQSRTPPAGPRSSRPAVAAGPG
jgi:drug/metabolite transporter (DMT)-like permease